MKTRGAETIGSNFLFTAATTRIPFNDSDSLYATINRRAWLLLNNTFYSSVSAYKPVKKKKRERERGKKNEHATQLTLFPHFPHPYKRQHTENRRTPRQTCTNIRGGTSKSVTFNSRLVRPPLFYHLTSNFAVNNTWIPLSALGRV